MLTIMAVLALVIVGLGLGAMIFVLGAMSPILIIPVGLLALDVIVIKRIFSKREKIDPRFYK